MAKRILWARGKREFVYYFFANFPLTDADKTYVGFSDEELKKKHGDKGFQLLKMVSSIEGVAKVELVSYQLFVSRFAGWKPEEVFPKVVLSIKAVYAGENVVFKCQDRVQDFLTLIKSKLP